MIPEQLKSMFGLNNSKDLGMANNIWKMLDQMADSDPESYKKFVEKNITQGLGDAKAEKQKKQKPYKIIPKQYMLLQMNANIASKSLTQQPAINEKLNLQSEKWSDIFKRFPTKVELFLNICVSQRVKMPTKKPNNSQFINFQISMLKDVQSLYYSLQGPFEQQMVISGKQQKQVKFYYCMILNSQFVKAFDKLEDTKRILVSLAISYFQQRLQSDRNPLIKKFDPNSTGKIAYYEIIKTSITLSPTKFKYGKNDKPVQFLLQQQVDTQIRKDKTKQKKQQPLKQQKKVQQKTIAKNAILPQDKPKNPFMIIQNPKQQEKQQIQTLLPVSNPQNNGKKLIEVLQQQQVEQSSTTQNTKIAFQIKQTQNGYQLQFLVHGISKISELDLQISQKMVKLKTIGKQPQKSVSIELKRTIDPNLVKAKMKKKSHILAVSLIVKQ